MKSKSLFKLLIIVLFLFFTRSVSAQEKKIALGVKIAPHLGWLKTDQKGYKNQGIVAGLSWGLAAEFYFAENYAFLTGFNFDFQNGKMAYPEMKDGYVSGELTRKYRFKYLEFPVMVKMKTNEINGMRFFGQIGMGMGIRLISKAEDVFKSDGNPDQINGLRLIDTQTKLLKGSMIVGAGIEYPIDNSTAIVAGINFNNGFTNALKGKNTIDSSVEHHGVPNFLELSLAVMF
ncbi:MAG: porin family protein [Bacteroidota bacterium]